MNDRKGIDAAMRIAREYGGPNLKIAHVHPHRLKVPHALERERHETHYDGPIHSTVAGRTDHLPMTVSAGSYVLPADHVSGLAEGNSTAGFKVLKRMFGGIPYHGGGLPYGGRGGPYDSGAHPYDQESPLPYGAHMKDGGKASSVPIVAAGGEYVLSPEQVREIGDGDLDRGHRVLDKWVLKMRKELVKTLKKLPGPKKD
jgi:hypothetical protein